MHRIFGDVVSVIVCFAQRDAGFDAASGHPHGKATAVMVTPIIVGCKVALAVNGPTEFPAPDDKRVV
jgi:hypothetical protein